MSTEITQPTIVASVHEHAAPSRLYGRALTLVHLAWWLIFLTVVAMNLFAIPLNLSALQRACVGGLCVDQQLGLFQLESWLALGFSPQSYAAIAVAIDLIVPVVYLTIAFILFRSKPNERVVLFVSAMLVLFGGVSYAGSVATLGKSNPVMWGPILFLDYLGSVAVIAFFFLFPNGHFVPRWGWVIVALWAVEQFLELLTNPPLSLGTLDPLIANVAFVVIVGGGVVAQIYRYRRVSTGAERRQTKWVVFGIAIAVTGIIGITLGYAALIPLHDSALAQVFLSFVLALLISLIPITIGIALLRSRLWDIDVIINRALVYGGITAIEAGLFAATITITQKFFLAIFGAQTDAAAILTTLIVVAAFDPIKKRVEHFVELHFKYRTRELGVFAEQVKNFVQMNDPQELVRRFLLETCKTFNCAVGAVYLGQGEHLQLVHSQGAWQNHAEIAIPLEYRGQRVGLIALGPRKNGDPYSDADHETLRQLGEDIAHAIQLTTSHITS